MSANRFPIRTQAAKKGEYGVNIVSKFISDNFGWLFKRNPQEYDFGIDAHIEYVTDSGEVTGGVIAAQIKCGHSFFEEKSATGYIFRGENKHFNYFANYPIPLIIIICHPDTSECFWVEFDEEATEPAGQNWKIEVPYRNALARSREQLQELFPRARDARNDIESLWAINSIIAKSELVHYVIGRREVEKKQTKKIVSFFRRLQKSDSLARSCEGKVVVSINGYNEDPRELYEIREVRSFIKKFLKLCPEVIFFSNREEPFHTFRFLVACAIGVQVEEQLDSGVLRVSIDAKKLAKLFMESLFFALNEWTDRLGMSEEENKRITFQCFSAVGMDDIDDQE